MLPGDIQQRNKPALSLENQTLDKHLKEKVVPYLDRIFREAAIEWLVATDQVQYI